MYKLSEFPFGEWQLTILSMEYLKIKLFLVMFEVSPFAMAMLDA